MGYTCKLTAAVWLGYPDLDANGQTRYMKSVHGKSVTGGSFPATIHPVKMTPVSRTTTIELPGE